MTSAGDVRLYMTLQKAAHTVKKAADQALLEAADLTTAQAAVLAVVHARKHVTQRQIADALGLNESAVTAMVRRLLARGLLVRERSQTDGRAWTLALSNTGENAVAAIRAPFQGINEKIDASLGYDDVRRLASMLTCLADSFSAATVRPQTDG